MTPKEIVDYIVNPLKADSQKSFTEVHTRMDNLETKIDSNTEFKWKIYGGAAVIAALVGFGFEVIK